MYNLYIMLPLNFISTVADLIVIYYVFMSENHKVEFKKIIL